MKFNSDKCRVVHRGNRLRIHTKGTEITLSNCEKKKCGNYRGEKLEINQH